MSSDAVLYSYLNVGARLGALSSDGVLYSYLNVGVQPVLSSTDATLSSYFNVGVFSETVSDATLYSYLDVIDLVKPISLPVKVWDGSAWVEIDVRYGGDRDFVPVKIWDGTGWYPS